MYIRHRENAQFLKAKNAPQILKYSEKMKFKGGTAPLCLIFEDYMHFLNK